MSNTIQLPSFLSNLEVVGTYNDALERCRVSDDFVANNPEVTITAAGSPGALIPPQLAKAYAQNDQNTINTVQQQNYSDFEPIRKNFENVGVNAWTYVRDRETGQHFFISYTDHAVTWVCPLPSEENDSMHLVMSFGSLDQATHQSTCGSALFTNDQAQELKDAFVALAAAAVAELFTGGLTLATGALSTILVTCAAAVGLGAFAFIIPVIGAVAVAAVFVVGLAVGAVLLFDWILSLVLKEFYFKCLVFNFDTARDWWSCSHYFDNVKIAGTDQEYQEFTIPKKQVPQLPPWIPVDPESITVSYVEIDMENESKFMEGLGFAISMASEGGSFDFAGDCPFAGATVIKAASPSIGDAKTYFDKDDWWDGLSGNIDVNGMPVGITLNTHHGADNNIYAVNVFIGAQVN
ncbi:MAG: hypothetical protein J6T40_08960 [Clostridiales bacterium]|nr:hypothetical protein [Clostridiales bacterium]